MPSHSTRPCRSFRSGSRSRWWSWRCWCGGCRRGASCAWGPWSARRSGGAVWWPIVMPGVFASALGVYIQTWSQGFISASRTALILATEPAWARAAAVVLAGQRLGLLQAVGAALVLAAIVGHELASLKFEAHVDPAPP